MRNALLLPVWLLIAVAGCHEHKTVYVERETAPPIIPDRQDVFNREKLNPLTPEARAAFLRDFPNVGVTSVELQPSETGPMLYRVAFVRDGRPNFVIYDRAGTIITPPLPPPQVTPPRPGFPSNPQ